MTGKGDVLRSEEGYSNICEPSKVVLPDPEGPICKQNTIISNKQTPVLNLIEACILSDGKNS